MRCLTLLVLMLAAVFSGGCTGLISGGRGDGTPEIEIAEATKLMNESKYPESVAAFQRIVQEYPNSPWAANATYNIAAAFVSAQNPHRDYAQALAHFEELLSKYPQYERATDARNWRQALKVIIDGRKEKERLLKNIEQLKQLDMRQEQKRLGR